MFGLALGQAGGDLAERGKLCMEKLLNEFYTAALSGSGMLAVEEPENPPRLLLRKGGKGDSIESDFFRLILCQDITGSFLLFCFFLFLFQLAVTADSLIVLAYSVLRLHQAQC